MFRIFIIDQNVDVPVASGGPKYTTRVPGVGEHLLVMWAGETRVCEVEDVWTHINLDGQQPYQGAVQVLVRWGSGIDPAMYLRRFQL